VASKADIPASRPRNHPELPEKRTPREQSGIATKLNTLLLRTIPICDGMDLLSFVLNKVCLRLLHRQSLGGKLHPWKMLPGDCKLPTQQAMAKLAKHYGSANHGRPKEFTQLHRLTDVKNAGLE
jgi:hypothetical protein